jgi:regulator of nucleoside diphosphate kinase
MTPEIIALIVVVLYAVAGLAVLVLGGQLIRYDLARGSTEGRNSPRNPFRLVEDLRPLQNLVVEFFARSRYFSRLLGILTRNEKRPSMGRSGGVSLTHLAWPAAFIMAVTGLVRFRRRGLVLTGIGREVQQRIRGNSTSNSANAESLNGGPNGPQHERILRPPALEAAEKTNDASPDMHMVSEAIRRGALGHLAEADQQRRLIGIGELRKPRAQMALDGLSGSTRRKQSEPEITDMDKRTIIMTVADHEELRSAIVGAGKLSERGRAEMKALETELSRAEIVLPDEVPSDVITMNSRAELLDLGTKERMEFTLVLPIDAHIENGKISVGAPLGAAMLGHRVGDEFEWIVPYGCVTSRWSLCISNRKRLSPWRHKELRHRFPTPQGAEGERPWATT